MEVLLYWNWFEIDPFFKYFINYLFQAGRYTSEFDKRVFAVALTDSPMIDHTRRFSSSVLRMLHKVFFLFQKYIRIQENFFLENN